jgi:hypothetical protein
MWRLLPFLFVAYVLNTIDRINISFAKLRMASDLGLSDAAYGIGAAAFFAGYILFEVPSNLYTENRRAPDHHTHHAAVGPRDDRQPGQLAGSALRRALPARRGRGRLLSGRHPLPDLLVPDPAPWTDHLAVPDVWHLRRNDQRPLAAAIMLHLDGWMGLRDWQALFVVEGIPAVLLALVAYRFLDDSPAQAAWLSPTEKSLLASDLGKEVHAQQHGGIRPCSRIHASTSSALPSFDLCQHQYHRVLDAHADPGLW